MTAEELDQITYKIIGCAMKVHSELGNGFQEVVYQRALAIELERAGLIFSREPTIQVLYFQNDVGGRRVDFIVEGAVSVEIKAIKELSDVHLGQAKNYLEAFNIETGLLINFGSPKLTFKRLYLEPAIKQK